MRGTNGTARRGTGAAARGSAAAAVLLLALSACSGDDESTVSAPSASTTSASASPSPSASNESDARAALEKALKKTGDEKSASVRLAVTTTTGAQSVDIKGSGVLALGDSQKARLTLELPADAGGGSVEVRVIDGISYVQLPQGAETGLPPDAAGKFLKIDPNDPNSQQFGGLGQLGDSAGGLEDSLEQLRNAKSVEEAGSGQVEGEDVTLYEVVTSPTVGGSPPPAGVPDTVTYTVAVDGDDLVREIRSTVPVDTSAAGSTAPSPGADTAQSASVDATFTVVEYGVDLGDLQAPPADQIVDLSQLGGGGT